MTFALHCPIKINLILRVFSKLPNGYHEIYSLFWQKTSAERLTICPKYGEITGDSLRVTGMELEGENLVTKALALARKNKTIPPLDITLYKVFPAGSGIGAGSGNAAAVLKWLAAEYCVKLDAKEISKLGADVAFLASENIMAEARGVGEKMLPFPHVFDYTWLLIFPKWRSGTKEAYARLDKVRQESAMRALADAENDIRLIKALARGERAGLLPNDFYPVVASEHAEYAQGEDIAEKSGARAWGLCGSGSAFFALYSSAAQAKEAQLRFAEYSWTQKTYIVE